MTADNIGSFADDELVEDFKDLAKRTRNILARDPLQDWSWRAPERLQLVSKLKAIARAPLDRIQRLLEDDDLDVRGWAAMQFMDTLPNLSWASFVSLNTGKSTVEVLDRLRHVRKRPPTRPTLREMLTDALVERFVDAATREYWTRFAGDGEDSPLDLELRNRIVGELIDIIVEVKRRGALARLLPFLESDNITVRAEAARATITIDPDRATKVLEAVIASGDSYELGAASRALENFRAGEPVVWGVG
jgi:HEAT repeat protein